MYKQNRKSIQKRALRLLYNDYTSTYDSLLAKANGTKTLLNTDVRDFKILNDLNPTYKQDLFYLRSSSAR